MTDDLVQTETGHHGELANQTISVHRILMSTFKTFVIVKQKFEMQNHAWKLRKIESSIGLKMDTATLDLLTYIFSYTRW